MSHRGNLVLVDENRYSVRLCHCALGIPQLMFWGPEFAINSILGRTETQGWYDLVWDEGSVLIDQDKKVIILYGGEYISNNLPYRQLYIEFMQNVWKGWEIQWGHRGLVDIVAYLKFSAIDISRQGYSGFSAPYLGLLDDDGLIDEWPEAVISIKLSNNDIRVQYATDAYQLIQHGHKLIDKMIDVTRMTELVWEHDEPKFPIEGVHIDIPSKHLYFWSARSIHRPSELQNKWEDWTLLWLKDDYQQHIELTENRLKFPMISDKISLQHLRAYLLLETTLDEYRANNSKFVSSHGIELPDYATYYVDKLPSIDERTKIFNRAVDEWRASNSD